MSHLQRQIQSVRRRLTLGRFVHALGWAGVGVAGIVWLAILSDRLAAFGLSGSMRWWALAAVILAGIVAALAWAVWRRPTAIRAARDIDRELGTKDRFATALHFQASPDEFASATRQDAEAVADQVSLRRRFRPRFPRAGYYAGGILAAALLTAWLMPSMDLLHHRQYAQQQARQQQATHEAKEAVKQALAQVRSVPKNAADAKSLKQAEDELKALLDQPKVTPAEAHRKALEALQNVDQSMRQKIESSARFAQLQQQKELMKSLDTSGNENAHLKAAKMAMKQGNFAKAAQEMQKAAQQFQKMTPQQQQAMAKQMQQMANQLQQAASQPGMAQQMQQHLQQMGATAAQAKQMTQLLQQAANGNSQAQQKLQQMANQLAKQAGNASGQMQQQLQQTLQQMQGKMAATQATQQMAQAAGKMAQAMGQGGQQQMASAGQSMQQQFGQMEALQQDLRQMQAMQQSMNQAAGQQQAAANGQQPGPGQGQGQGQGQGPGQGLAQANGRGGSKAGTGHSVAPLPDDSVKANYKTEAEQAPQWANQDSPKLASFYVNAPSIKGESHIKMSQLKQATAHEAAQSGELQHIPPPVREAVKAYFDFSK